MSESMPVRDLLIEIGTEELPPRALQRLSEAFRDALAEGLGKAGLACARVTAFATPRRLAVLFEALPEAQADREVERRGPALKAAFDADGNPTRALQGFARSCGAGIDQLEKMETDKGAWMVFRHTETGRSTAQLIPELLEQALAALPIPKRMRWGSLDVEFVRPVHWIVMLFGDEVIDAEVMGIKAGRETRGHRFHHPDPLYIGEPSAYAPLLETRGHVLAGYAARREAIRGQVLEVAASLGGQALIKEALLDEVTALVEWPVALAGSFDPRFLEVPAEALISSMQDHQKYFPVLDKNGGLMPHFITVANIDSRDIEQVRAGNERVIRPRLADADFFWNQDRKQSLADRIPSLKTVVYQKKLGTLYDKTRRVAELAGTVATLTGSDIDLARRAAELSKCDLMTDMVYEFTDLQGIMGRYYAAHDGEPEEVALALDEQYMPRHAGDALPTCPTGQALAIADKIDTLTGIFGIGQIPTGTRDPYALRRAALGLLRIIIERDLDLDLEALIKASAAAYGSLFDADPVAGQVFDFVMDRLRAYYQDAGLPLDGFEAVLACRPTRPRDFDRRIRAVTAFRELSAAASLAAANKRIRNILKKTDEAIPEGVDDELLHEPAEKTLAETLHQMQTLVAPMLDSGDYAQALSRLADLREPVDAFFDHVMVMTDDTALRLNRLALLDQLSRLFLRVADISLLQS